MKSEKVHKWLMFFKITYSQNLNSYIFKSHVNNFFIKSINLFFIKLLRLNKTIFGFSNPVCKKKLRFRCNFFSSFSRDNIYPSFSMSLFSPYLVFFFLTFVLHSFLFYAFKKIFFLSFKSILILRTRAENYIWSLVHSVNMLSMF
jgi:hypothetical protein